MAPVGGLPGNTGGSLSQHLKLVREETQHVAPRPVEQRELVCC